MTRQEAIHAIMSAWLQADQEYLTTREGALDSERKLREALRTLGVTDEEMNE